MFFDCLFFILRNIIPEGYNNRFSQTDEVFESFVDTDTDWNLFAKK